MKYYIARGYQCIQAFLQQLLNKVFISALDNDLDLVTIIVPADQPPPPALLPATSSSSRTRKHNIDWAKIILPPTLCFLVSQSYLPLLASWKQNYPALPTLRG
ncbi:hypothetical protein D8674_023006 [Pyrus ussuriensis x Pyrus communis]|uniref:Uncharacterized protein n=1 Tax=Pyrus ussuriensis x Pyrus communis TaxID=2448454 RepID=A0A5N5GM74_9ROSA|nr:hypothetical protein D8674_023006 [Pyrus ussuriensis x Pyrus communis]